MSKKKEKIMPFFKYIVFTMIVISIITLSLFKFIDILPGEYFLILTIFLALITFTLALLVLAKKSVKKRVVGTIISIIYIIFLILVIIYELNTIGFLKKIGFKNFKTENYSVLVLKNSDFVNITDLNTKNIGSLALTNEGLKSASEKIKNKIECKIELYDKIEDLKKSFINEEIEAMLIEDSILNIIIENDGEFASSYKSIYKFSLDVETEDIAHEVNITNTPFNIYISGIDTYGTVSSVSRSDVNMVITVNPNTHKILITSIPRDYYVELYNTNSKDKLTHAGIYGIETSVKTIENLLGTKINYYVKVNFSSVIKVVDALNGVNVYSKHKFISQDGYSYNVGYNYVDGEKALSFVRERKSFIGGDRVRVENQAALIKALIDKAVSPSIITNYSSLLTALSDLFITNLDTNSITEFIKMQVSDMPSWEIDNYSLDGTDAYDYTYSFGSTKLYVMNPDIDTVINAKNKINALYTN
ncbi:MAG: LytR family transcriptional regulator [Firmicutes bacterium]|nr:LytR family transcriptional regulator [Bacillota bacterium]